MAKLAPFGPFRALDNDGAPLNGGLLYTYESGTTTPKATYTDASGDTANTNPVVLDAAGYADVWLGDGAYRFVLKTSAGSTLWTVDDITGDTASAFGSQVVEQSGNLSVTDAYFQAIVNATDTQTHTLLPAASAGSGWYYVVNNTSASNDVTIDPDGSEQINGTSSATISPGQSAVVYTDGTEWWTAFDGTFIQDGSVTPAKLSTGHPTWDSSGNLTVTGTSTLGGNVGVTGTGTFSGRVYAPYSLGVTGGFKNMKVSVGSNTQVTITADELILSDSSGVGYKATSVNVTADITVSGANGLDTGTEASNTWYSVWVIYNGTTVASLLSTSATSPTMSSGYTYKARVGWIRNDGSSNLYSTVQYGRKASYRLARGPMTSGASGSTTTPTWTSLDVSSYAPSTACAIFVAAYPTANSAQFIMAPENTYDDVNSTTNPPPLSFRMPGDGESVGSYTQQLVFVTAQTLYYASTANAYSFCNGWEDNI